MSYRFQRYYKMFRLFMIRDGYKRANYMKKTHYLHSQGEHCYFQIYNFNTEPYLISIGNNVHIATGVSFFTHDIVAHMLNYQFHTNTFNERVGTVLIGNNVFVGGGSTLLYGITIGDNVIIAANSVVTKDIQSNSVVAGQPARVIGSYDDYIKKMRAYSEQLPWQDAANTYPNIICNREKFFWK